MAQMIDMRETGYKGPKPFRVDYVDVFGRRKRPHFKTKAEADRFRVAIESELQKAKEGLLPDWFVIDQEERKDLTIAEVFDEYVKNKIELKTKESAQRSAVNILNGIIERYGKTRASQITVSEIDDYRKEWLKSGNKETSFQAKMKAFKTMLAWGFRRGLIVRNPLDEYEFKKGLKSEEKEALDEDEIKLFIRVLQEKRPDLLDYFIMGVNTGMRIAELWSIVWPEIDTKKRMVWLPKEKTKTNEARKVPLNNACMDVIDRLSIKKEYAPFVLWHPPGTSYITNDIAKLSKSFLGKRHTPHSWRVTFATLTLKGKRIRGEDGRVYRVRGDLRTIAEIGGWSRDSSTLLRVYQKVEEEQKREAVDLINIGEADILPLGSTLSLYDTKGRNVRTGNENKFMG